MDELRSHFFGDAETGRDEAGKIEDFSVRVYSKSFMPN